MQRSSSGLRSRRINCFTCQSQRSQPRSNSRRIPARRPAQGTHHQRRQDHRQCSQEDCRHASRQERPQPSLGSSHRAIVPDHRCRGLAALRCPWPSRQASQRSWPWRSCQRFAWWVGYRQVARRSWPRQYQRSIRVWRVEEEEMSNHGCTLHFACDRL